MWTPIFYDPRQNVAGLDSFSPSAGKPARFVELMKSVQHRDYAHNIGPVTPITQDDLRRVHCPDYVRDVFAGVVNNGFENRDPRVPESCLWTIGSLLAASKHALKYPDSPVCSPSSGFHHAGYAYGGGFCTFNGLMVVAAKFIAERPDFKVAIIDCDLHYGDGIEDILQKAPGLAYSVRNFTAGRVFHGDPQDSFEFPIWLRETIRDVNDFDPDLVLYQAGADPHVNDPMGGFLDDQGLLLRDSEVFQGIDAPVAWNLAGGYQKNDNPFIDPVLRIHRNTIAASDASYRIRQQRRRSA